MLERLLAELRHHADPAQHRLVHIAPARNVRDRLMLLGAVVLGGVMIPVALAVPLLPAWPFAIVLLVACARLSERVRVWLQSNRAFNTGMSLVRTRPERMFVWANQCMCVLLGEDRTNGAV